jgi:hypothetical protein
MLGASSEPLATHLAGPIRTSAWGVLLDVLIGDQGHDQAAGPRRKVGTPCSSEGAVHPQVVADRCLEPLPASGKQARTGHLRWTVFENSIASASISTASSQGHTVDALAPRADEGRWRLR